MRSKVIRLAYCNRGNFSLIFGLSLIPMICIIGLGVDVGRTMRVKTALDAAADAAALSAATQAARVMQTVSPNYDPTNNAIYQGEYAGNAMFDADAGRFASSNYARSVIVTPSVQNGATSMTAVASYTATPPTAFGNFLGVFGASHKVPVFNIAGSATSSLALKKYINIYVLIDVSQSMGIAGSTNDMTNLFNLTKNIRGSNYGCVFGCHVQKNGDPNPATPVTNEQIAHQNSISLRIDVIKKAISNMVSQAQSAEQQAGGPSVSIGLYTFEQNLQTFTTPKEVTSNYQTLQNYVCDISNSNNSCSSSNIIDLGSETNGGGAADSYSQTSLENFAQSLPVNGVGDSPNTPANYVFIMTDGTFDITWSNSVASACPNTYYNSSHCVGPYSSSFDSNSSTYAADLQAKATVGVIYTTYLPIYQDPNTNQSYQNDYANLVLPISNKISPALQTLATSSTWFIEAQDSSSINTALANMFAKAAMAGRLIQ